jgi:hypothetical protein
MVCQPWLPVPLRSPKKGQWAHNSIGVSQRRNRGDESASAKDRASAVAGRVMKEWGRVLGLVGLGFDVLPDAPQDTGWINEHEVANSPAPIRLPAKIVVSFATPTTIWVQARTRH